MSLHNQNTLGNDISTGEIVDLAVTTAKLAADAVTNAKLADNAVQTENITNLHVTEAKIADGAITKDKISATGDGALKFLRIAANGTDLEFSTGGASAADSITIGGNTMTLEEWLLL